jgi:hypothetical protein
MSAQLAVVCRSLAVARRNTSMSASRRAVEDPEPTGSGADAPRAHHGAVADLRLSAGDGATAVRRRGPVNSRRVRRIMGHLSGGAHGCLYPRDWWLGTLAATGSSSHTRRLGAGTDGGTPTRQPSLGPRRAVCRDGVRRALGATGDAEQISMAEPGEPRQNRYAEQPMRTTKREEVALTEYRDFADVCAQGRSSAAAGLAIAVSAPARAILRLL